MINLETFFVSASSKLKYLTDIYNEKLDSHGVLRESETKFQKLLAGPTYAD